MDTSGLITIKSIVDDLLIQNKESESEYLRYLRLAERGVVFLNLFSLGNISTYNITIDRTKLTYPLPRDYAKFLVLGFIENGRLIPIIENEKLQINRPVNCGVVESDYVPDENYQSYYQNGVPYYGSYRINEKMNRIEFASDIPFLELVMEYVSTGLGSTGESTIPETARECLVSWIQYRANQNNLLIPQSTRMEFKAAYEEEYQKFRQLQFPSIDEMMNVWYVTKYQR